MFGTVLKNGQLLLLVLADSLRYAAFMAMNGIGIYYFRYVARNIGMMTLSLTVQSVLGLGAAFVMPILARKIGK
jgi:Na+/melibiose symporter-like transporter